MNTDEQLEQVFQQMIALADKPPAESSDEEKFDWVVQTSCTLGGLVARLLCEIGANEYQLGMVFSYMLGRAQGLYLANDEPAREGCIEFVKLGYEHGVEAIIERDGNAPGTETVQ